MLPLAQIHAQEIPGDGGGRAGLDLGGGVGLRPRYEGSDEHALRALPIIRAYANSPVGRFGLGEGGLNWSVRPAEGLNLGLSLGYQRGRKESASQELRGLGDVKGGTEVGAFGNYRIGRAFVRAGAKTLTTGTGKTGTTAELGLGYLFRLNDKLALIPSADVVWANDKYMQRYFGVSSEQSLNSGLPVYTAGSGLKSAGVGLMLRYRVTDAVNVFALARESVLLGDAADSPVTRNRSQPQLMLGASYRFELK
ncbi:MipA/OmpV family protein [Viridibacterium curvum]|uniref:MipA/OmpV family protein n=1 Tax=Viridibacterium curvum TaxID=1101404 RepID=A0ABP9QQ79_9RHOO